MLKIKFSIVSAIIVFSLLLNNNVVKADHMVGSDLTWTCVGHDSFLVKVTIYRDCNGIPMHPISLGVNCKATGTNLGAKNIGLPSGVDITPTCGSSCTRCTSSGCTFAYGIQQYIFQTMVVLSNAGSCCEISFSVNICCRSANITTGMTWANFYCDAMLNRCATPCDNSPTFTNPPVAILCIGQDFVFNHGAQDIDLNTSGGLMDSLVFEWGSPLGGPNSPLSYTSPYSYDKAIYFWGFPNTTLPFPRGIHLDPNTGDISFRPMKIEVTVMAIEVNEYRNGVKIGVIRRDLQIIVINCPNNHPPSLGPAIYYKEVCAGNAVTFTITSNDLDPNDTLTMSWNHGISGGSWSDNNGTTKHPTGNFSWTPGLSQASSLPYSFTVTVKDDACPVNGAYTHAYQILVKPPPRAAITVIDSNCGNYWFSARALQGAGPSFAWLGATFNFSPSIGALTHHTFTSPGLYPYQMTITAQGCSQTYSDTVIIDTFLSIIPFIDKQVCKGTQVTLTANYRFNSGPVKFKWSTSNNDTNQTKTFYVTRDTVVKVTIRDTLGCKVGDSIIINSHDKPIVTAGPDQRICAYTSTTVTTTYSFDESAIKNIEWKDLAGTTTISNTATGMFSDSGLYVCKVVDTLGCFNTDTIKVIVNPQVIAFAPGATICLGDKVDLEADLTGSKTGTVNYKWIDAGNTVIGSTRKINVKPSATTDYWLKVSETIGGIQCKDSVQVHVKVNPLPVISLSPIPQRCIDGAVLLLNSYVTVDGSYKSGGIWTSKSSGLVFSDRFDPKVAGVGTYYVRYEYTNPVTGCYKKDSTQVTINALPKVMAGKDDSVCTGDGKYALKGSPLIPAGVWLGQGVEGSMGGYTFNPEAPGIINGGVYSPVYRYTDSKGCVNTDTLNITVFKTPVVDAGSDQDLCIDASPMTMVGNPGGGTWSGPGLSGGIFNPASVGAGVYQLTYTYTNVICTQTDKIKMTVHALPILTLQTIDGKSIYCNNDPGVGLLGNPAGGTWSGPGVGGNMFDPSICTTTETTYDLKYSYKDAWGCQSSKILKVTVRPAPSVLIDKTGNKLCFGNPYTINSSFQNANGILWWKDITADGLILGTVTNPQIGYSPGDSDRKRLYFRLHIKTTHSDNVCAAAYDSIKVNLSAMPEPNFDATPREGCVPLTVDFRDSSTITLGSLANWEWDFGDGSSSMSQNPQHLYSQPGVYKITLKAISDAGCEKAITKDQYIMARIVPDVSFLPKPELTLVSVPTIKFLNSTKNETGGIQWYWNFDDGTKLDGGKSSDRDPEYKYSDTGKYDVKLLAVNEYGCKDSMIRRVIVLPDVIAYIPTAFKEGGLNPQFKVICDGFVDFELKIYSRWGELLYQSTDYKTHGWKGNYLNSETKVPTGVYVYILKLKGLDALDYKYSGTVTFLR